jgi:hypothetical protein
MALVYFSVVPLHRWVSIVSAALLLLSLVLAAFNPGGGAMALAFLGAGMLALGPGLMGGGMHRYASSRTLMHLRPNGRLRMLLAATVAITLFASIAVVPVIVSHAMPLAGAESIPFRDVSPLWMFAIGWSVTALMWAGTFITGASQLQGLIFGLLPLVALRFGKALAIALPSPPVVLGAGVLIWVVFGLWYMQVRSLRPMPSYADRTPADVGDPLTMLLQSRFDSARGAISPAGALNQYLFGAFSVGTRALLLGSSWVLLAGVFLLALASFAFPGGISGEPRMVAQLVFLPMFLVTNASMGFSLTRRARMVWLRPGQDRATLFAHAERGGLIFCLLSMGTGAAAFLALSLLSWPGHTTAIFLFAGAQITFALCLLYCGLSLTRGWAELDVSLCVGLIILFLVEVIMLRPWGEYRSGSAVMFGFLLLLVPALRWHASRRWRALDWRVARMLTLRRPA